jgi:Spy/CpxP family protein refolding chaperone
MKRRFVVALSLAWLVVPLFLVSAGWSAGGSQNQKDERPPLGDKVETVPWDKLDLTAAQKSKIASIRASYQQQIDELEAKAKQLKKDSFADCIKTLSDAQLATLKKLVSEKAPTKESKDK